MVTIKIVGKSYPMSFSVMAAKKIAAKYGTIERFLENMNTDGTTERNIDDIIGMLDLLINQGCAYKNYFEKDVPAPEDAPVVDGKWTPLPKEALEIAVSLADFDELAEKIQECIDKGKKKKVEAISNSKNIKAGQE